MKCVQRTKRKIKTIYKSTVVKEIKNCLGTQRSELVLQLAKEVLVAAVVPHHVKIEYSFVVEALSTGAHH